MRPHFMRPAQLRNPNWQGPDKESGVGGLEYTKNIKNKNINS